MVRLVLRTEHPSAYLQEAMTEPLWEGLAAATVENSLVPVTEQGVDARLAEMGLLFRNGHPTAAGYALLLRWHREFRNRHRSRWWPWKADLSRHEIRMSAMWGC